MKKHSLADKHLYLPKGERNGILLFFILSIIGIILFRKMTESDEPIHMIATKSEFNVMPDSKWSNEKKTSKRKISNGSKQGKERKIFVFNPNTTSRDSLYLLGFSKPVVDNLFKYKNKGGKIKSLENFKKIYGIDTSLVAGLEKYVLFSDNNKETKNIEQSKTEETHESKTIIPKTIEKIAVVELNEADSLQLISLKGIGPYYAKKIMNMRKTMGGFVGPDQILECKIIPDSVYYKIRDYIWVDSTKMDKIDLNEANYRTLIQHPYFEENLVKVILNFKENHGPFTSLSQLKKIKLLTREKYDKIIKHFKI